jgi:hypothetical protein
MGTKGHCYLHIDSPRPYCKAGHTPTNGPKEKACEGRKEQSKCAYKDMQRALVNGKIVNTERDATGLCYKSTIGFGGFYCKERKDGWNGRRPVLETIPG